MHARFTLRTRIVLAFLAFGLVLPSLFAIVALTAMANFERILMGELLHAEAQSLVEHLHAEPDTPLPTSQRIRAYVSGMSDHHDVPAWSTGLAPGTHVLDLPGHSETYVDVRNDGARRLYFVIDMSNIAARETFLRWLFAAVILVGTLVSGSLGLLLAGRLIAPVQRLLRWVEAASPSRHETNLRTQFADDEVGALAAAFDRYQARLDAFLQREREFTADASHELRAPLSVVQAGLDLLAEDPGVSQAGQRALQRSHRCTADLANLLDALLYLARNETGISEPAESVAVLETWQRLIVDDARASQAVLSRVELVGDADAAALAPARVAKWIFGQLLRQGCEQAGESPLRIMVKTDCVEIGPWRDGAATAMTAGNGQTRSDRHFGLTLVGRLCQRLGWRLQWPSRDGESLRLWFTAEAQED